MFFISAVKRIFRKGNEVSEETTQKRSKRLLLWGLAGMMVLSVSLWVLYGAVHIPKRAFCEGVGEYSLAAQTQGEREEFFLPFGYKAHSLGNYEIIVPSEGKAFEEYNEIQKKQGLSLNPYGGKEAQMYVFSLEGKSEEKLYGFLVVLSGRVIGCHISDCMYPAQIFGLVG